MLLNALLHLQSAQHVSGTYMPIIRSSRLYLCCYRKWCVIPWLLVVGSQEQGSRMRESAHMVCNALVAGGRQSGAGQQAMRPG